MSYYNGNIVKTARMSAVHLLSRRSSEILWETWMYAGMHNISRCLSREKFPKNLNLKFSVCCLPHFVGPWPFITLRNANVFRKVKSNVVCTKLNQCVMCIHWKCSIVFVSVMEKHWNMAAFVELLLVLIYHKSVRNIAPLLLGNTSLPVAAKFHHTLKL